LVFVRNTRTLISSRFCGRQRNMVPKKDPTPSLLFTTRKRRIFWLAITVLFTCIFSFYPLTQEFLDNSTDPALRPQQATMNITLQYSQHFLLAEPKSPFPKNFYPQKNTHSNPTSKNNFIKLSIFQGKQSSLNLAVLQTLNKISPLIVYDIMKNVNAPRDQKKVKYTNVLRRVKDLFKQGFLEEAGWRETQPGFRSTLYQLTTKARVAYMLCKVDPEKLVNEAPEDVLVTEMAALTMFFIETNPSTFV
jgi:hypothetical protein